MHDNSTIVNSLFMNEGGKKNRHLCQESDWKLITQVLNIDCWLMQQHVHASSPTVALFLMQKSPFFATRSLIIW